MAELFQLSRANFAKIVENFDPADWLQCPPRNWTPRDLTSQSFANFEIFAYPKSFFWVSEDEIRIFEEKNER